MKGGAHVSHFVEVKVQFKDRVALHACLTEVFGKAEVHAQPVALFGYQGDNRSEHAPESPDFAPECHVVVRRADIGGASNDIGYRFNDDGTVSAYVSDFDRGYAGPKLAQLAQRYARHVAVKQARAAGYTVSESTTADGTIRLTLKGYAP